MQQKSIDHNRLYSYWNQVNGKFNNPSSDKIKLFGMF